MTAAVQCCQGRGVDHQVAHPPPESSEALAVGAAQGFMDKTQDDAAIICGEEAARKAVSLMAEHASRAGCALHELAGGGFLLSGAGSAREVPCLRAVGAWLRLIGRRHV